MLTTPLKLMTPHKRKETWGRTTQKTTKVRGRGKQTVIQIANHLKQDKGVPQDKRSHKSNARKPLRRCQYLGPARTKDALSRPETPVRKLVLSHLPRASFHIVD